MSESNKSKGNVISTIENIDMSKILGVFPFVGENIRKKADGGVIKKKKTKKKGKKK
jgi:hypothetical protein